jgi:hypothetical protein
VLHLLVTPAPARPAGGVGALVPPALAIPAEWRIAVVIIVGTGLAVGVGPFVIRQSSRAVEWSASGLVAICLYGEYLHTRRRLIVGAEPHSMVHRLDGTLEATFAVLHTACEAATRVLGKQRRLGRWWVLVLAIAITPTALSLLLAAPTPPRSVVAVASTTEAVWRPVDGWVMTGRLRPVAAHPLATCTVGPGTVRATTS